jgi:hypothetical protein
MGLGNPPHPGTQALLVGSDPSIFFPRSADAKAGGVYAAPRVISGTYAEANR